MLPFLITFFSLSHYIVCHTMYCFWLHFILLAIPFSVIPCTVSVYTFISSLLHYLSFHVLLLITFFLLTITLSVISCTVSDYTFFSKPFHCLSYHVLFLITLFSLSHSIVCHTMYCFWLHFYLFAITLSVIPCTASDYTFFS